MKLPKGKVETVKTVVIAVLITAIVAFVGGMHYQGSANAKIQAQAKDIAKTAMVKN